MNAKKISTHMFSLSIFLLFSSLLYTNPLFAQEKSSVLRLIPNQTILEKDLRISWASLIIEEIVNEDGTAGEPVISVRINLECKGKTQTWSLLLPWDYKSLIKNEAVNVTFKFFPYLLKIKEAEFGPASGWMLLEISQIPSQANQIAEKSPVFLNIRPGLAITGEAGDVKTMTIDISIFVNGVVVFEGDLRFDSSDTLTGKKPNRPDFNRVSLKNKGKHRLRIVSKKGNAEHVQEIDMDQSQWLQADYLFNGKDKAGNNKGEIEVTIQNQPFYYR